MEGADFFVEDLLDFSNGGDDVMSDAFFHHSAAESSAVGSSNSSLSPSFPDSHFSADLCHFPYEDTAELEWLSNFVEESFSSDDLHKLQLIPNPTQFHNPTRLPNPNQHSSSSVPAKARSKRSRVAPNDWSTRLLMVAPTPSNAVSTSPATSSSSNYQNLNPNPSQKKPSKRRESNNADNNLAVGGEVRRCLHCAAEKTPQWRTGPMGPKTLCNACGVRYKSGRLVPEYRPAASPTFVSTKHSNSHRKVIELRRQKELQQQQQQQHFIHHHHHQRMLMGVSNGGDDYFIHHHLGQDYRQMI